MRVCEPGALPTARHVYRVRISESTPSLRCAQCTGVTTPDTALVSRRSGFRFIPEVYSLDTTTMHQKTATPRISIATQSPCATVPRCSPSRFKHTTRGQATYQSASLSIVTGSPEAQGSGTARENVESKDHLLQAFQIPRPKQTPHLLVTSSSTAARPSPQTTATQSLSRVSGPMPEYPRHPGPRNSITQRQRHCTGSLQYTWSGPRGRALPPPTAPRDPLVTRSRRASRQARPSSSAASEGFPIPATAAREA